MSAPNPTPETTSPTQDARIWQDGERMTPNLTNEYWEKVREYWRNQPPGAVFDKILEFQTATPKGREQYRLLGQRTLSFKQELENKAVTNLIDSSFLSKLKPLIAGSEAAPFLDEEHGVVYKIFSPDPVTGSVGWRLTAYRDAEGNWQVEREPATVTDTLDKLYLLHAAGGLPTEIIGLTTTGDVMAKQPQAKEIPGGVESRARAVTAMRGIQISDVNMDGVRAFWADGKAWLLGDLHAKNIMRDAHGQDRVMDALMLEVPGAMISEHPAVARAVHEARRLVESGETNDPDQATFF